MDRPCPLNALNFVDYIVLAVLVGSGVLATLRGLTRELMGLAGWGVAVLAARLLQPMMITLLEDYILEETVVEIMAWSLLLWQSCWHGLCLPISHPQD